MGDILTNNIDSSVSSLGLAVNENENDDEINFNNNDDSIKYDFTLFNKNEIKKK